MGILAPLMQGISWAHHEITESYTIKRRLSMLSLGYPDILQCEYDRGVIKEHPEAEQIRRYHGIIDNRFIPEAYDYFSKIGIDLTVIDFKELRGESRFGPFHETDLNYAISPFAFDDRFDIVLDPGTLEHVFNVPVALENIMNFSAPGGYILHWNPLQQPNHGFYNFSPTFYHDFYSANRMKVTEQYVCNHGNGNKLLKLSDQGGTSRFHFNGDASIMTLVRNDRPDGEGGFRIPVQTKYKQMLGG